MGRVDRDNEAQKIISFFPFSSSFKTSHILSNLKILFLTNYLAFNVFLII